MTEHILLSPLGMSPGAVTGAAFALRQQEPITRVVTLSTNHAKVRLASQFVAEVLASAAQPIDYSPEFLDSPELRRIDDTATTYMTRFEMLIQEAQQQMGSDGKVHVAITAGRSGMGVLAAWAASMYGADKLWHLWVSEDIELRGHVDVLPRPLTQASMRYLDPTPYVDEFELVPLPLTDLRPLHTHLWRYRQTGHMPPPDHPFFHLFKTGAIQRFQEIFPAEMTMKQADDILELQARFARADGAEQNEIGLELLQILGRTSDVGSEFQQRLAKLVMRGAEPGAFMRLIAESPSATGFWARLKKRADELEPMLTLGLRGGGFLLNLVVMYLQVTGYLS